MKKHKRFFLRILLPALLSVAILPSCNDEIWDVASDPSEGEIVFKAIIDQDNLTRADESGFAVGDRMGIFISDRTGGAPMLKESGNKADNLAFTLGSDGVWKAARKVYWNDLSTKADFYGYYPFVNRDFNPYGYEFSIRADQGVPASDSGEMSAYEASDLLLARVLGAEPGKTVELSFRHALSGLKIVLQRGTGFEEGEWDATEKIVTVNSTVRSAIVDMSTMSVTPSGSLDGKNIRAAKEEPDRWRAIAVPQTVGASKPILGITVDGIPYTLTKSTDTELQPSKMHSFTIKVDKKMASGGYALTLVAEQILPWENDKISHQFGLNSYVTVNVARQGTAAEAIAATGYQADKVVNLKLTGNINEDDLKFIRGNMRSLTSLNLKEVTLRDIAYAKHWSEEPKLYDNILPDNALADMGSLRRLILPDRVRRLGYRSLASLRLNTTLVLPNSLRELGRECLNNYTDECTVIFPDSLERIEACCFYGTGFKAELKLPSTLKAIESDAFHDMPNVYGHFELPAGLEELGGGAFSGVGREGSITGNITIPEKIKEIPEEPFVLSFNNRPVVTIPEGVVKIGKRAFTGLKLGAPLKLPEGLTAIESGAFYCTRFVGELKLPSTLVYIAGDAFLESNLTGDIMFPGRMEEMSNATRTFGKTDIKSVTLPDRFTTVPAECFSSCKELKMVKTGRYLDYISDNAFAGCENLSVFICLNPTPPRVAAGAFNNANTDRCILQVPEQSLDLYRNAEGWRRFANITAYHELTVNIPEISSLNNGIKREGIVTNEGVWEVTSCPSWCKVTPMSGGNDGDKKSEIEITVNPLAKGSGDREGRIVLTLKGKGFTTDIPVSQRDCRYGEDSEILLQKASAQGREIPIFLIAEGLSAADIGDGSAYIDMMKEAMEDIFALEPMKSYRNHFTVTTAIARSPQSGIMPVDGTPILSRFDTENYYGSYIINTGKVASYARSVSSHIDEGNASRSLVVVLMNEDQIGGNVHTASDGTTIVCLGRGRESYPYTRTNIVSHYVVGEGFGRLGNEGIHHFEFIQGCPCPGCNALSRFREMKAKGNFANLSLSRKLNSLPWKHLVYDPRYSQVVDVYEGGYGHSRGVWRSEPQSVMSTFIPYFNTISRETLVRRIMEYAGLKFDFEQFAAKDKIEIP